MTTRSNLGSPDTALRGARRPRPKPTAVILFAVALALTVAAPALAHHGRDFLLAETAEIPHPRQGWAIARQDYVEQDDGDGELELEPSLLVGITRWLAFEVHGHAGRADGESVEYESTAPALHLRFARPGASWGVGVSAEYEIAHQDDAPDSAAGILSVSGLARGTQWALNLTAAEPRERGADTEWGYALGVRRPLTRRLHWGLEARGSLEGTDDAEAEDDHHDEHAADLAPHDGAEAGHGHGGLVGHEVLAGLYFEASEKLSLNLGLGTGVDGGPDLTVRTALVWRFW